MIYIYIQKCFFYYLSCLAQLSLLIPLLCCVREQLLVSTGRRCTYAKPIKTKRMPSTDSPDLFTKAILLAALVDPCKIGK
jgi:hypothetical protein